MWLINFQVLYFCKYHIVELLSVLFHFQNALYQSLLTFRNQVAREGSLAPFLVCSNGLLASLARARYGQSYTEESYFPPLLVPSLSFPSFLCLSVCLSLPPSLPPSSFLRPSSLETMKAVEGVSDVWLQKHGDKFLVTITDFCQRRGGVEMDVLLTPKEPEERVIKVKLAHTTP